MLEWMAEKNYDLPKDRTFLQPNVFPAGVSPPAAETSRRRLEPVKKIVFLGWLEPRKGIQLFLAALDLLSDQGALGDASVTFLGKPSDLFPESEIRARAARWRVAFRIRTDLDSNRALAHLKEESQREKTCQRQVEMSYSLPSRNVPFWPAGWRAVARHPPVGHDAASECG